MALRKIVTLEDPVLRKTSRKVEKFDKRLWDLLDDMKGPRSSLFPIIHRSHDRL